MTEPLRYGFHQHSSRQLLEDELMLVAWKRDLEESLRLSAAVDGHKLDGDVHHHEPIPLWWVDVPDPITGEATSMLVGEHMARMGEADDLGPPAAYDWRVEAQVRPSRREHAHGWSDPCTEACPAHTVAGRTPGNTQGEG